MEDVKAIILAGGSGSRLWPLSRELYPKQLLNLNQEHSLLESTFLRVSSIVEKENILTVTNMKHTSSVRTQLQHLIGASPKILSEPLSKNTAPAIASAVKFLGDEDAIVIVLPSDHLILNTEKFLSTVKKGIEIAKNGYIVTFGINPSTPETGYGYIDTECDENIKNIQKEGLKVSRFVEKPNLEIAKQYLEKGTFYWNSGIFIFKASVFLNELQKYAKDIYSTLDEIKFDINDNINLETYSKMPDISVDYAVMEKSEKIALIPLESDWNDLGSWLAVYETSEKDADNNVLFGNVYNKDSKNSLVFSTSKMLATIGLEDTIIVETNDAILACKKDRAQEVKCVYEELKKNNNELFSIHKTVYRPWGSYTVVEGGEGYLIKTITVQPKQKLSIQIHNHRSEHWVVLSGTAKVVLEDDEHILHPGEHIDIPLKAKHSLQNPFDEDVKILEVQKGDYISEDDIIRLEDIYGRA